MITGSVTLNGLTDKQLVIVLEAKIRHDGALFFNPQQMQQAYIGAQAGQVPRTLNNNVVVSWNTELGYKATLELMAELTEQRVISMQAA